MKKVETKETVKPVAKSAKAPMQVIEGATAINAAISAIAKTGKTLERAVHIAAVSTLVHADKHGDITLANKLVDAIPSMARKNALRDWYLAHGKFDYSQETKALTYKRTGKTKLDEAMATPFWEFKPEKAYVPFDLTGAIVKLVTKANKAHEHGDKIDMKLVSKIAEVAGVEVAA